MFQSSGPFKQIECPGGRECPLLNCIFGHDFKQPLQASAAAVPTPASSKIEQDQKAQAIAVFERAKDGPSEDGPSPPKKRRLSASREEPQASRIRRKENDLHAASSSIGSHSVPEKGALKEMVAKPSSPGSVAPQEKENGLRTQKRVVSPPPLKSQGKEEDKSSNVTIPVKRKRADGKTEALYPRIVPKPPAPHATRFKLLVLLHEQISRLNELVRTSSDPGQDALLFSPQELIKEALDEEERAARANAAVYANVLKLRIAAFKKMKLDTWRAERVRQTEKGNPELKKPQMPVRLETGLLEKEELAILDRLVTPLDGLDRYGYVTVDIGAAEVEEARRGVESAHGYEVCDRCSSRFQVFPGRREDGELTSRGECKYHEGRLRKRTTEYARMGELDYYSCCHGLFDSEGCSKRAHHVFKVAEAKRLALILPFEHTPLNEDLKDLKTAVCFDCEMGYTTLGMELIRLTATAWPSEEALLDVLVRPLGEILDLNSTFSGVWPEHFANATPYDSRDSNDEPEASDTLRIVDSPSAARALLFRHLTPSTPLIGHALENDLNAARIIHPTVVDTVLLYPHPRGLPVRNGLKYLMNHHLKKAIQTGGARGHDSKEDARAAGQLVRLCVRNRWKKLRDEGWTLQEGILRPPPPKP